MCETEIDTHRQLECVLLYEEEEEKESVAMDEINECPCEGEGVAGWKNTIGAGRNGLHMPLRRGCNFFARDVNIFLTACQG